MTEHDQPTAIEYYVIVNGERRGPYPQESLKARLGAGEFTLDTLVWSEQLLDWTRLATVLGIDTPPMPAALERNPSPVFPTKWVIAAVLAAGALVVLIVLLAGARQVLKPELPFEIHFRPSLMDQGLVARIYNHGERLLSVKVDVSGSGQKKTWNIVFNPGETHEIGWMEGWKFVPGEKITISHPDFRSKSARVPGRSTP